MKKLPLKYLILIGVVLLVLISDQWTKALILEKFRLGESLSLIPGFFSFTYVQNKGAAFGLFAQTDASFRIPFFLIVPVVALMSIAYVFKKIPEKDFKMASALSLIISGAVGNLLDRFRHGYVVDFLDFFWTGKYHFPAFNIADSAICVGVGILMLDLVLQEQNQKVSQKGRTNHVSHSR